MHVWINRGITSHLCQRNCQQCAFNPLVPELFCNFCNFFTVTFWDGRHKWHMQYNLGERFVVVCCRCHRESRPYEKGEIAQAWTTWPEGVSAPNGSVVCRGHRVLDMVIPWQWWWQQSAVQISFKASLREHKSLVIRGHASTNNFVFSLNPLVSELFCKFLTSHFGRYRCKWVNAGPVPKFKHPDHFNL